MTPPSAQTLVPVNDMTRIVRENVAVLDNARAALASGWWLNGTEVREFCKAFADYVGTEYCLGVANGTDALEIALRAICDIRGGTGTEAVTVANAGGYSTVACRLAGLTPVFADIELDSQLASLPSVVGAVTDETRVVIVTHLYGGVVDVPRLRAMMDEAGRGNVSILEDCAQAHGARLEARLSGSMGDISTFSFYPTKNLGAFGDGGAILTSDQALADHCRKLHQYGWSTKYNIVHPYGRNSRLDEVQAAVLRTLLPRLDEWNAKRVAILDAYCEAAPSSVRLVRSARGTVSHLAVLLTENREDLIQHFIGHGIMTDIHYPILDCDQVGWRALPQRLAPGGIPVSRASVSQLLTLPCFPTMTEAEIGRVCAALSSWTR